MNIQLQENIAHSVKRDQIVLFNINNLKKGIYYQLLMMKKQKGVRRI